MDKTEEVCNDCPTQHAVAYWVLHRVYLIPHHNLTLTYPSTVNVRCAKKYVVPSPTILPGSLENMCRSRLLCVCVFFTDSYAMYMVFLILLPFKFTTVETLPFMLLSTLLLAGVNDIVLIRDDNIPRVHWKLGKIYELPTTKDIRSVKVILSNGRILNRSINCICPLEIQVKDTTYNQLHRSDRLALLPPKSYIYFVCLFSTVTTTLCLDSKRTSNTTLTTFVYLQECGRTGVGIYSTKDGFYCFKNHSCNTDTYLRVHENNYTCRFPCECPKWASDCSTYTADE
uniref:DUF5641 domain-containing protein n=1 Tax=Heterorhabditis bacteriophora TaxID=37862 RepID=A0A1I7WFQ3_HETBA